MNDPDGFLPRREEIADMIRDAERIVVRCQQQQEAVRELMARVVERRVKMQTLSNQLEAEHPLDRLWIGWRTNGPYSS